VNGRKIDYKYALDDGGNPTTFNQLAKTLVNQDHVFAVTGVATAFFSPNLFVEAGSPPTATTSPGTGRASRTSSRPVARCIYYPAGAPGGLRGGQDALAEIAIMAYGVAASAASCQSGANSLTKAGYKVSLHRLQGQLPGHHRGHRRPAHEAGRGQLRPQLHGRAGQRHHGPGHQAVRLNITQLWLNGNDQSTLDRTRA
jgi:hypothetical protein